MKTKILLFFGMLLISTSIFSQDITCYNEPDMPGVFIKDVILDENTSLDSVMVNFKNLMFDFEGPKEDDWNCEITQLKDNSVFELWNPDTIDYSMYGAWIDLANIEYEGDINFRIYTVKAIEWDSVCIATSPKESVDSTDLDTVLTSITSYNISGESKTKSGGFDSKEIIIDNDTNIINKIDSISVSCAGLDGSGEEMICEIISNQSLIEDLYLSSSENWYNFENSYEYISSDSISLKVNIPKNANLQCDSIHVSTTIIMNNSYVETYKIKKKVLDSINQNVSVLVGLDELEMNKDSFNSNENVSVYPNPTIDNINVDINDNSYVNDEYTIKVVDIMSKTIFEEVVSQGKVSINLSELGNEGLYFVYVLNENSEVISVEKVILK